MSNKLRTWRIEVGLSQNELAHATGVSRWVIHLCERGLRLPDANQQLSIAAALGVSVDELFPTRSLRGRERKQNREEQ